MKIIRCGRKKIIIMAIISILCIFAFWVEYNIIVRADEGNDGVDDDFVVDETDYSLVERGDGKIIPFSGAAKPTEEDIIDSLNQPPKIIPNELPDYKVEIGDRYSWIKLSNITHFSYYAQKKNYTCGPACAKMALKYLTGNGYTQTSLEQGCLTTPTNGTTLFNLKSYVNFLLGTNTYYSVYTSDYIGMREDMYIAIVTFLEPPIIGVKEDSDNGWPFELNAHYVIAYSVSTDKQAVRLADPWAGYVDENSPYKKYTMTTYFLHRAFNEAGIGYMY